MPWDAAKDKRIDGLMGQLVLAAKRKLGAEGVVIIAMYKDGETLKIKDQGMFPQSPADFYQAMSDARRQIIVTDGNG